MKSTFIFFLILCHTVIYSQTGDAEIEGNLYVRGNIIQGNEISSGDITMDSLGDILFEMTTSANNLFTGYRAGEKITQSQGQSTGIRNHSFGHYSLQNNLTGEGNTSVGFAAGRKLTGGFNTTIGTISGYKLTGGFNTFVGYLTGSQMKDGNQNTFLGSHSGASATKGFQNTFIGTSAGRNNFDGDGNVYIGAHTGAAVGSGMNNVFVGTLIISNANRTNSIVIGHSATSTTDHSAVIGNGGMKIIGGYANWSNLSDGRFKKNIKSNVPGLEFILKLKPVTYNLREDKLKELSGGKNIKQENPQDEKGSDGPFINRDIDDKILKSIKHKSQTTYTGLIAQEVQKASKELNYDFSGVIEPTNKDDHYRLAYSEFIMPLIKAVQEQQIIIEGLKTEIDVLKENRSGEN